MTPSYCLSSPRNTTTTLSRQHYLHTTKLSRSSPTAIFRPLQNPPLTITTKPLLPIRPSKTRTLAAFSSSLAGEEEEEESKNTDGNDTPGMAQAFHISSGTASAISICMAFAALAVPLFMRSLSGGAAAVGLKTKVLSYVTLLFGFYMAWNIGANDVANAMGTSVGSGALTLRQAVVTAGILEFSGALLMGTHVTSTMQKGILVADVFQGRHMLLFSGLLASLAAAGTWLQVPLQLSRKSLTVLIQHTDLFIYL